VSGDRGDEGRAEQPTREEVEALIRESAAEILALCARYWLDERQSIQALKGAGLKLMLSPSLPGRRRELLLRAIENEARELHAAADPIPEEENDVVH
jgi:hypothetical protein